MPAFTDQCRSGCLADRQDSRRSGRKVRSRFLAALLLALASIVVSPPRAGWSASPPPLAPVTAARFTALGFVDGWVDEPRIWSGQLFGHGFEPGLNLTLLSDSKVIIPVEILRLTADTVDVRADLTTAPIGSYQLVLTEAGGAGDSIPWALFLGPPPVIRVPLDLPSIQAAIDLAEPCTEIRVDAGEYQARLTVWKPVRLVGIAGRRHTTLIATAGERVCHILPGAGSLTEISGFTITDGDPASGPGGGIWCEAPARIAGNRIRSCKANGPGGWGGGIAGSDGCRITGNEILENQSTADGGDDFWLESGMPGTGGGIRCPNCRLERNRIEGNHARAGAGIVADGIFLADTVGYGNEIPLYPDQGRPVATLLRGRVEGCVFRNSCGSNVPNLRIDGPSEVRYSTFTATLWDLCIPSAPLSLRGSIDFDHNTLAGVEIDACLTVPGGSPSSLPHRRESPAHFRMHDNIVVGASVFFDPDSGIYPWPCLSYGGDVATVPIEPESVAVGCNLGVFHTAAGTLCDSCSLGNPDPRFCAVPCVDPDCPFEYDLRLLPTSPALPENREPGCPDTLGALGVGCGPVPILLGEAGLERLETAVRLFWTVPQGITPVGFRVEREADGALETLTTEPIRGCQNCEWIDRSPPVAGEIRYWLIMMLGEGQESRFLLGATDGAVGSSPALVLAEPAPNPARGEILIRFAAPGASRFRLVLRDAGGRTAAVVREGPAGPGEQSIRWAPRDLRGHRLASGVYFLRLETADGIATRRLLILR